MYILFYKFEIVSNAHDCIHFEEHAYEVDIMPENHYYEKIIATESEIFTAGNVEINDRLIRNIMSYRLDEISSYESSSNDINFMNVSIDLNKAKEAAQKDMKENITIRLSLIEIKC